MQIIGADGIKRFSAEEVKRVTASFTRPADTTAYASGDLVANSTTAGTVAPLAFDLRVSAGVIRSAKIETSNAAAAGAAYRLHLYAQLPVPVNGDNGAWSTPKANYLGSIDVTLDRTFSDGTTGQSDAAELLFVLAAGATTVYGLIEARGAITPASASTIAVTLGAFPS